MDSVAAVLREEFERVARDEDLPMAELVEQIADATGYSTRQIYNFRSGKWPLPPAVIPALCRRFKSQALLEALGSEVERLGGSIADLGREQTFYTVLPAEMAVDVLREVCSHHNLLLDLVKKGIDRAGLAQLDESTERIVRLERNLFRRVEYDHELKTRKRAL
jgi:hypothetical protein